MGLGKRSRFFSLQSSLRAKITLGVVLPLIVILGIFTAIEYRRHLASMLDNLSIIASHAGQLIETSLRHGMVESDFEGIQEIMDAINENSDLEILYILDTDGRVIFAPNQEGIGTQLNNEDADCQPCHHLPVDQRPSSIVVTLANGQSVFRSMKPIENGPDCIMCHDPKDKLRGLLLTDISIDPFESALVSDLEEKVLWWAGTILTIVIVVYLSINRYVLRGLEKLLAAIGAFAQGQMPSTALDGQSDEIGQLANAFVSMAQEVEDRHEENEKLSKRLKDQSAQRGALLKRLITAQEDERMRLARDLHDDLGQALSGLALRAEAMEQFILTDQSRSVEHLGDIKALVNETTDRMYELIVDLRPSILDDLGLLPAIQEHAARVLTPAGIHFDFDTTDFTERLPPEIEVTFFRVFQEALNNIVRHSKADQVRIKLSCTEDTFEAEIVDNGQGFDSQSLNLNGNSSGGFGLLGMQERVAHCGGQFSLDSTPGAGTLIRIRIPLEGTIA